KPRGRATRRYEGRGPRTRTWSRPPGPSADRWPLRPRASRRRRTPRRSAPSRHRLEIGFRGHLEQARVSVDDLDAPTRCLDETRAIRRLQQTVTCKGMAKAVSCEGLRRLHRPETVTRHGLLYAAVWAEALQRVADREAGDDAVPALRERREHPLDHLVGHQRAGSIVDED